MKTYFNITKTNSKLVCVFTNTDDAIIYNSV